MNYTIQVSKYQLDHLIHALYNLRHKKGEELINMPGVNSPSVFEDIYILIRSFEIGGLVLKVVDKEREIMIRALRVYLKSYYLGLTNLPGEFEKDAWDEMETLMEMLIALPIHNEPGTVQMMCL